MGASSGIEPTDQNAPEIQKVLFGRFLLPDQTEHACSVVNLTVEGADFQCTCTPPIGGVIICYLEKLGRIECTVTESIRGGFRVGFLLTGTRKERFLTRLQWLTNKQNGQIEDERQYNRRQLDGARSRITLEDGREYFCEIIDVSLTGAALAISVLPAIGTRVHLGKMLGRVVRYLDNGIALQFLTAFRSGSLADIVDDEWQRSSANA